MGLSKNCNFYFLPMSPQRISRPARLRFYSFSLVMQGDNTGFKQVVVYKLEVEFLRKEEVVK
jgi:hypothetical protein